MGVEKSWLEREPPEIRTAAPMLSKSDDSIWFTDALYDSDETKRRFEIMAREVFSRFKALLMEPSALRYAVRHDDIETIYRKLQERRDIADGEVYGIAVRLVPREAGDAAG